MQLSQKQLPASRAHIMRLRCWTQLASIHMGLLVPKWIPQARKSWEVAASVRDILHC